MIDRLGSFIVCRHTFVEALEHGRDHLVDLAQDFFTAGACHRV